MSSRKRSREAGTPSRTGPRARSTRYADILPPSSEALSGPLKFTTRAEKDRYTLLSTRSILPWKIFSTDTLRTLHAVDSSALLIDNIGWKCFFDCTEHAYIELTREFYTTFEFTTPSSLTLDTPGVIKFRLMGRHFSMTLTEFNIALGFTTTENARTHEYVNSLCDYRDDFNPFKEWRKLSTDPLAYHPSRSKIHYLKSPVLKLVHRFLAFNFSGRRDTSGICSKAELFFLWCMLHGIKVNLGFWLATQFQSSINRNRALILGSYITLIAINLGVFRPSFHYLHIACESEPLDMATLTRMGLVTRNGSLFEFVDAGRSPIGDTPSTSRPLHNNAPHEDVNTTNEASDDGDDEDEDNDEDSEANNATTAQDENTNTTRPQPPPPNPQQTTLDNIARKIGRIAANLMGLFEHFGLTPRQPPTP
ncbi:UNVERIFIED_CONTAM: hypothetical protein Sindi_1860400 [Sesamum indicum]